MRRPSVSSALANNIPTTSTHPASNYNNSNLSFLYQKRPSSPSVLSGGAAVAANHNNLPPHLQRRPSSPTLTTPSNLNSSGGSGLNLQQPLPQQYANTSRRPSTSSLIQSPISPSSPISPAVSYISNNGGRRPSVINNGGKSPTFNKAMNLPQRLESTQQHPYQGQLQQQQRPSFSSGTNNPIYERKNSLPNESSNSASTAVVVTSDTSSEVFSPNTPIPRPNNNGRPRSGGSSGISKKQVPPPGPLIEMDDDYKDCVQDFLAMFDEVTLENEPYLREYTESILSRWYRRIARNFSVSGKTMA